jgi:hypothetical protein
MNAQLESPSLTPREKLWVEFLNSHDIRHVAEVGVWKGEFAATILRHCPNIDSYTLVDPWRPLANWNKPYNVDDNSFQQVYAEALRNTDFAAQKRRVLKATTLVARDSIEDGSLDFAYIDGDHTLRGIVIDALSFWPKIKAGGYLAGDDFVDNVWQHGPTFEPTLVKPFIYSFAEAVGGKLQQLPNNQFLIEKPRGGLTASNASNTTEVFDLLASLKALAPATEAHAAPRTSFLRRFAGRAKAVIRRSVQKISPRYRERCNVAALQAPFPEEYRRAGVVFLHVPKAAGTSITLSIYGRATGHISLEQLIRSYPHSMRKLRSCAVFRDPAERFVSAFRFLKRGGMNSYDRAFAEQHLSVFRHASECAEALIDGCAQHAIANYMHFRSQTSWVAAPKESRLVDCLVPLGRLDLLQEWLLAEVGRTYLFPTLNESSHSAYDEDGLTERACEVIQLLYADDYRIWRALCSNPTAMIATRRQRPGRNRALERLLYA